MKHFTILFIFIFLPFISLKAQHIFQKTYGGTDFEYGYVMRLTNDGGSIIGGVSRSPFTGTGGNDCYLVKLDSLGHIQWAKSYGTTVIDVVNDLWCTTDGGYIFGGYSSKSGGGAYTDGNYVIKVNSTGDTAWTRIFNFRNSGGDCYELTQANDGNYIIGNYTPTKGANGFLAGLIKLNKNGDTIWTRIYDGVGDDWFYGIAKTYDGGYALSGYTKTPGSGGQDFLLLKTDSNGNKQWVKAYGGSGDDDAYGHSVKATSDSGYIMCGETTSFGAGNTDMYLVKADKNGNLQWSKTYGGTGVDIGHSVETTSDGGYIVIGWTKSFGGGVLTNNENVYVVKTNSKGDTLWTRAYGGAGIGSGGGGDLAYDVKELKDAYLICGRTYSYPSTADIYFIRIDKNGNSGCHQYYTKTVVKTPVTKTTSPVLAQSSGCAVIHQVTNVHSGGTEKILCDSTFVNCKGFIHVGFNMSDTARCFNGNTFTFTNTSTVPSGSLKHQWVLSDTTSDTNNILIHHFRNTGIFNIKLVVTSDKGCSDSISKNVTVNPNAIPGIIPLVTFKCFAGNTFNFKNNSTISKGQLSYKWIVSDGFISTDTNLVHHFNSYGMFTVKLKTISDKACEDSTFINVTVKPEPYVYLGKDTIIKMNGSILLDAGSGMDSYYWSNGKSTRTNLIDSSGLTANKKTIWVSVTKDSCVSNDTIIISFDVTSSVRPAFRNYFNLYPNPVKNIVFIEIHLEGATNIHGMLTSITGQTYETFTWNKISNEIKMLDISHLPAGIYLLKLITAQDIRIFRIDKY